MEYVVESFRHGELILEQTPAYNKTWSELKGIINNVTDNEIIQAHEAIDRNPMSISQAINSILKELATNKIVERYSVIYEYCKQYYSWALNKKFKQSEDITKQQNFETSEEPPLKL